jgi:hypothetical protein
MDVYPSLTYRDVEAALEQLERSLVSYIGAVPPVSEIPPA